MLVASVMLFDKCIICEHPVRARSFAALEAGQREHLAYLEATADRTADPHFRDARLNLLAAYSHERQ